LEAANIETRQVFGGNILRQPGFMNIEHRLHGTLEQSDVIMRNTFFVGVYPGLTEEMIDYVIETITNIFRPAVARMTRTACLNC
jgi:CDP-4-dehydro-6-deoxyglucose reductase, E1